MDRTPQKILIVTGEESGDMRAASLVRALKARNPGLCFFGVAGNHCRREGVETFTDISELAVIGFTEVLRNILRIKRVFDLTLAHAHRERPAAAILVDYPGFNLRLAGKLKEMGIRVIYYVSPQIWAWKESRINTIKRVADRMLVLFPFEKDLYSRHHYNADLVGHPLIDEAIADVPREAFLKGLGLGARKPVLGILPGSRAKEISRHLPVMLRAARLVRKEQPDVQLLLLKAKNLGEAPFTAALADAPDGLKISQDYYNALNACDIAMVCSGTATLETALLGKPLVVVYRTSRITGLIAKLLIRIPYIALVNIVAGKKIAEELLQEKASPGNIAAETLKLLDPARAESIREELARVKALLGAPGASERAAQVVLEEITQNGPGQHPRTSSE